MKANLSTHPRPSSRKSTFQLKAKTDHAVVVPLPDIWKVISEDAPNWEEAV